MKVVFDKSDRFQKTPQALLGMMRLTGKTLKPRGLEYIDLDSITTELPDDAVFLESYKGMGAAVGIPANENDIIALKEAIAGLYGGIYNRIVHSTKEIAITPGSRETSILLCLGMLNRGDSVAIPNPGLAMYRIAAVMAEASPISYSLLEKNDYLPNFSNLLEPPPKNLRLIFLNYPHNPTGAEADLYFYREIASRLRRHNILAVLDSPFAGISDPPIELPLQLKKGGNHFLELHSFGFPYGLNGLGFATGHKGTIFGLEQMMQACGVRPSAAQVNYALLAIKHHHELSQSFAQRITERRQILSDGLREIGWTIRSARQGPFIWAKIPSRNTSVGIARKMFMWTGVRSRAGSDFGEHGEGYLRLSLTVDKSDLEKALENIRKNPAMHQKRGN